MTASLPRFSMMEDVLADTPGPLILDVRQHGQAQYSARPSERVVQRAVFEADDPSYAGTMTMNWHFAAMGEGTEVIVTATDVPPGIDQAVHEAGIASSLANLASHVEASTNR